MNIADLIGGSIGNTVISSVAQKLGIEPSKAKWVVSAAVPLIVAALNYNAKNKGQAANINSAIDNHAGGLLGTLGGLFSGGVQDDGNKILGHVFGKNTGMVTDNLSQQSGLSSNQVGTILSVLAPVVMGALGQEKQSSANGGGIGDLIGGLLGGASQSNAGGGLLGSLLGGVLGGGQKQAQPAGNMDQIMDLAGVFFNQGNSSSQKGNVLNDLVGMFGK